MLPRDRGMIERPRVQEFRLTSLKGTMHVHYAQVALQVSKRARFAALLPGSAGSANPNGNGHTPGYIS